MFVQNQRLFLHVYIKSVATNKNTKQETHKESCNKNLTPCALYPAATGTPGSPEEELKGPEVHEKQLISIMKTWSQVSVTTNSTDSDIKRPDQNKDQVYSQTSSTPAGTRLNQTWTLWFQSDWMFVS